jgi:hypothetical protein
MISTAVNAVLLTTYYALLYAHEEDTTLTGTHVCPTVDRHALLRQIKHSHHR